MLKFFLKSKEVFNEELNEISTIGGVEVQLEHSLYSIAKWEEIYKKPFEKTEMNFEILMTYLECMCITPDIPSSYWVCITPTQLKDVLSYIKDPHTATTINNGNAKKAFGKPRTITAELVYSWMISLGIPMEFQHWHFNRLLTLISVCTIEKTPPKKMSRKAAGRHQHELNAKRLAQYNTRG